MPDMTAADLDDLDLDLDLDDVDEPTDEPVDEADEVYLPPEPYPGRLRRGDRGHGVVAMQRALGVEADGTFGGHTDAALRSAQAEAGLPVGPLTPAAWEALSREREE